MKQILETPDSGDTVTDPQSFAEFLTPHWADMARLARRFAPSGQWEDALQDALSDAWRKRASFDPTRGSARNWLLAIVADQAYKGRRRLRPAEEFFDDAAPLTDQDVDLDLRHAVARLTRRQRLAVTLHYHLGMPVMDAAVIMGCAPGTVKSTLSDARASLRRMLGEDYR